MPRDRDFKRKVRRRMRKTGEAYTTARARLASRAPSRDRFERLTGRARQALAAARDEAERVGADIESEDLLLGLLHVEEGMSARVLHRLGVDPGALERRLRAVRAVAPAGGGGGRRLGRSAGRAIELAFGEAAALEHPFVGTEHLLLGLVAEGTSVASRVLAEAGVRLEATREVVSACQPWGAPAAADLEWEPLAGGSVGSLLEAAEAQRSTGTFMLRRPDAGRVSLHFLFGHLFHAVADRATGDEAVVEALSWRTGEFAFNARSRLPGRGSVQSSLAELIARAGPNPEE